MPNVPNMTLTPHKPSLLHVLNEIVVEKRISFDTVLLLNGNPQFDSSTIPKTLLEEFTTKKKLRIFNLHLSFFEGSNAPVFPKGLRMKCRNGKGFDQIRPDELHVVNTIIRACRSLCTSSADICNILWALQAHKVIVKKKLASNYATLLQ